MELYLSELISLQASKLTTLIIQQKNSLKTLIRLNLDHKKRSNYLERFLF
jgi:hypothetical protein